MQYHVNLSEDQIFVRYMYDHVYPTCLWKACLNTKRQCESNVLRSRYLNFLFAIEELLHVAKSKSSEGWLEWTVAELWRRLVVFKWR